MWIPDINQEFIDCLPCNIYHRYRRIDPNGFVREDIPTGPNTIWVIDGQGRLMVMVVHESTRLRPWS